MSEMITDPSRIAELAAQFAENDVIQRDVVTTRPSSTEVHLPGGFLSIDGTLIKFAEIRELNGADEEALASATNQTRALNTILSRGLVRLGDNPVTGKDLDNLLSGDRDAILLGIRIATFGNEVTFAHTCTACLTTKDLIINLETDVNSVELSDPVNDRMFTVKAKAGEIALTLPNGLTAKRISELDNPTSAELITAILSGCISSINGEPSFGTATARALGIADRELLVTEIYDRASGPRLGEVTKACEACDAEISVPLSLADLFRI